MMEATSVFFWKANLGAFAGAVFVPDHHASQPQQKGSTHYTVRNVVLGQLTHSELQNKLISVAD
jgi:hypothetical protein